MESALSPASQKPLPDQFNTAYQIKAHSVYLSQFQLLPYQRSQDYFQDQLGIPLSTGSIVNFNLDAASRVVDSGASNIIRMALQQASALHIDETGININATRHWLHCASTPLWTQYSAHRKRGTEAMVDDAVIPVFQGVLCHDHWTGFCSCKTCISTIHGGQTLLHV